jgi:hypothetical protein
VNARRKVVGEFGSAALDQFDHRRLPRFRLRAVRYG